eukprot:6485529-Amphidinium_carterae.4
MVARQASDLSCTQSRKYETQSCSKYKKGSSTQLSAARSTSWILVEEVVALVAKFPASQTATVTQAAAMQHGFVRVDYVLNTLVVLPCHL